MRRLWLIAGTDSKGMMKESTYLIDTVSTVMQWICDNVPWNNIVTMVPIVDTMKREHAIGHDLTQYLSKLKVSDVLSKDLSKWVKKEIRFSRIMDLGLIDFENMISASSDIEDLKKHSIIRSVHRSPKKPSPKQFDEEHFLYFNDDFEKCLGDEMASKLHVDCVAKDHRYKLKMRRADTDRLSSSIDLQNEKDAHNAAIVNECILCMEKEPVWCCLPCGHVPFCDSCIHLKDFFDDNTRPFDCCPCCRSLLQEPYFVRADMLRKGIKIFQL